MTITFAKSNYGNGLKQNRICRNIKIPRYVYITYLIRHKIKMPVVEGEL
jgi:hypothetical protein